MCWKFFVTSDLLKLFMQQEKDERKHMEIYNDFHTSTSFKEWKKAKSTEECASWHIIARVVGQRTCCSLQKILT
jgi:hypothetical protein